MARLLCFRIFIALLVLSLTRAQITTITTPYLASNTAQQNASVNDIAILNFALFLENTDSTILSFFLPNFTQDQFVSAGYNASVYQGVAQVVAQEVAHAAILSATVAAIGGTPAPKCVYNYSASGIHDVVSFIQAAAFFEMTGTSAYDGGLNALTDPNLQQATATIATVEARHSSYLNQLLAIQPFPTSAFDTTLTPAQAVAVLSPFIVSCPYTVVMPTVRPYGVGLISNVSGVLTTNHTGPISVNVNYTAFEASNDLQVLNYALVLEQLEAFFYAQAQSNFSQAMFTAAGYNSTTYNYFNVIASNEQIHAAALRAVITARGGTPYPNCTYSFPVVTVADYIHVAMILENTGVMAYDGAVNGLADTALQQVAATIATVEARHAAFLNLLAGASPFPTTNDTALAPATIVAAASAFQTCPFTITLPATPTVLQVPAAVGVRGDPSFVGFLGQKFQLHGIPNRVFNILSSSRLQLNARFAFIGEGDVMTGGQMKQARRLAVIKGKALPSTLAWSHEGTFLSEMGLRLDRTKVHLLAGKYTEGLIVTVDGKVVQDVNVQVAKDIRLQIDQHSVTVTHPLVTFTIVNSDKFFNIEAASLFSSASTLDLDGLLGQTYSAEADNRVMGGSSTVREHLLLDYLVSDEDALFSDDFVRSRFVASS